MQSRVDARGLSCPQPVIRTRAAMAEAGNDAIVTIVDNDVAATNVSRMAEKAGWTANLDRKADGIYVELAKDGQSIQPIETNASAPAGPGGPAVLLVKSDRMGTGDDELGHVLIRSFFHTLLELDEPPATIIFLNSGVKLAVKESPVLEDVKALESRGVEILACGTCLNYFDLGEKLGAGIVSNMYSIAETLMAAGKIISP
jgi:selenium metabolism protein YedF